MEYCHLAGRPGIHGQNHRGVTIFAYVSDGVIDETEMRVDPIRMLLKLLGFSLAFPIPTPLVYGGGEVDQLSFALIS